MTTKHPLRFARPLAFALATLACSAWAAEDGDDKPAADAKPAAADTKPATSEAKAPAAKGFADIIKDAKRTAGLFPLYQKDGKVWIEIAPDQFDTPFWFQVNTTRGIGQSRINPHMMLADFLVEWHKVGTQVQLVARNHRFAAQAGTPMARAVAESFADSLVGSAPILGKPHPERKSVLIEVNALLLSDIPAFGTRLESAFRIPYAFDAKNSSFAQVHASDDLAGFEVQAHYATAKMPIPPLTPSPVPTPPPPSTLEDARSMFLGFYYSIARLPSQPMASRVADSRVGHFVTQRWDYTDDVAAFPRQYLVNRWRLEKRDPAAASSPPVKPITFWLANNIPVKYRAKVVEGVLEWNKAFEKIGIIDAIVVKQQADDADFDTNDAMHASIRWYADISDGALATGPSRTDPRTGEILDADISFSEGWTRLPRRRAVEQLPSVAQGNNYAQASSDALFAAQRAALARGEIATACNYEQHALDEVGFALDVLAARGDIEPDSPEAEAIVMEQLKDVVTHEVGHTLGLTHNFRASTIYPQAKLDDPAFTRAHGLGGSVMDYNAVNIALQGRPQGAYAMGGIGPYDYWAIEYAYKPLDTATEAADLRAIAARSSEPQLAFANDLDAGIGGVEGMDPEVTRRDLGADPLAFAARRMQLSRELWQRLQTRKLKPGEQYEILLRNFVSAANQVDLAATVAAKYVGGVVHLRDHANSKRQPLNPVPAARQREALRLIADGLFRSDSFRFSPAFVARLVPDQFDRWFGADGPRNVAAIVNPDASVGSAVLKLQRGALDHLLADSVAARIVDAPSKMADKRQAFALSELYDTLQDAIWSELARGGDIDPMRRNLQREHLRRMVGVLVKSSATMPADARSLQRDNARRLQQALRAALDKPANRVTHAHLAESLDVLDEALKASLQRAA